MSRVRLFMAASVDGYIATADGGLDWLEPYDGSDFGYDRLMAEVEVVVVGRTTFDLIAGFPAWPYPGKRVVVLTHRPLLSPPAGVECHAGDVAALTERLRRQCSADIFIDGGAQTVRAFLDADLIDHLDLFTIPILLGQGIPRFLPSRRRTSLRLADSETMAQGVVRSTYLRP
ncbi:dihydrofolate reductase family protein [Magnetospirillum gryphiswaldense]|uniref:Dihydrofolate reductase n=1 Tax=Magnetospirillum gryphiswaldense TaxID=55518 RepID=A4U111_9PROT|nr:dihydrofolate reductase family protein [Magnetospirillum gryphiswaldense]CAM76568.1 Dihydrofolate reductase [Magnetospirillum gryphiswaldense MSR-1]